MKNDKYITVSKEMHDEYDVDVGTFNRCEHSVNL